MPKNQPIILITRPENQAVRFQEMLGGGLNVIISPVIRIRHFDLKLDSKNYSALIFTSQNAIYSAAKSTQLDGMRAFVVGQKTAELAVSFGMNVVVADGNADSLVKVITEAKPKGKLLFLNGKYSTGNVKKRLIKLGTDTDSVTAYEQEPVMLGTDAVTALKGIRPVILPIFSSRSAKLLAGQITELGPIAPIMIVAISNTVSDVWDGPEPTVSLVAATPTAKSMVKETLRLMR